MASSQQVSVFGSSRSVLGVMDMPKKPEMGIPEMYIRPQEPTIWSNETTLPTIPVFYFKALLHEKAIDDAELDKLFTACKDWGFFQVCTLTYILYTLNFKYRISDNFSICIN